MKPIPWVQLCPGVSMTNGHIFIETRDATFVWYILPVSYFTNGDELIP